MPESRWNCDVCVIGCGSFGAWTSLMLRRAGGSVLMVDAFGPGNARQSSGGETRLIRAGYGADALYTRWARQSLSAWKALAAQTGERLFEPTGVLWMARADDALTTATLATLRAEAVPHELLDRDNLARRHPQIDFGPITWAILEPDSGVLFARRSVQAVAARAVAEGARYACASAMPPSGRGRLGTLALRNGGAISAGVFVFALGPWLGKLFPSLLGDRIFPTRQEVLYFGTPAGDVRFAPPAMPAWIDFAAELYGVPDLEARGFKVAFDRHGPPFDPDDGERTISAESIAAARTFLAERFPDLRGAPLVASEVCQYENTSNGDFLLDRHPDFDDVWLVGGGSGHGFKHGPAAGQYVAQAVAGGGIHEPRFALATKTREQRREVH